MKACNDSARCPGRIPSIMGVENSKADKPQQRCCGECRCPDQYAVQGNIPCNLRRPKSIFGRFFASVCGEPPEARRNIAVDRSQRREGSAVGKRVQIRIPGRTPPALSNSPASALATRSSNGHRISGLAVHSPTLTARPTCWPLTIAVIAMTLAAEDIRTSRRRPFPRPCSVNTVRHLSYDRQ
jgi:hypothetical protein